MRSPPRLLAVALASFADVSAAEPLHHVAMAPTGRIVEIVAARSPRGIAAELPNEPSWRRAAAAVRDGSFRLAVERFYIAGAELQMLAAPCSPARACARGDARSDARGEGRLLRERARELVRAANLAAQDAKTMQLAARDLDGANPSGRASDPIARAEAMRRLYLLDRAIYGDEDPGLREQAARLYEVLTTATVPEIRTRGRIALASLRADAGDHRAAAAALAAVPAADLGPDVADLVAHLRAELGDPDRAFEALSVARDTLPDWDEVASLLRASSELDALREDPRFARMLGGP